MKGKIDIFEFPCSCQALKFQDRLSDMGLPLRILLSKLPAHHCFHDHIIGGFLGLPGSNALTVSQDRDLICNLVDLIHLMGDIYDPGSPFLQIADDLVEVLHLPVCDRRSRFVHDQDPGVLGYCFCDLHQLLVRDSQASHLRPGIQLNMQHLQQFSCLLIHLAVIDKPVPDRFSSKVDVLSHRHLYYRRKFLVDHRDPHLLGNRRRIDLNLFAFDLYRSSVSFMYAYQYIHQRRFPSAVLTHQSMY